VITVHSNVRGKKKDEVVEQLMTVENPVNPVEVVIHANMLKEGWDVSNLYTIVPLRAANFRTGVVIGKDILEAGKKAAIVESEFEKIISAARWKGRPSFVAIS